MSIDIIGKNLFQIILIIVVLILIFVLLDSSFLKEDQGIGIAVTKMFIPAHTEITPTMAGKVPL